MQLRLAGFACICTVLGAVAVAQAPDSQPLVRSTTRMVQVNVVVHTKKNEPAAGLSKDDFEIYDNGVKQQVAAITVEGSAPSSGEPATPPKVPNIFSNHAPGGSAVPRAVTVILLDGLNTAFGDQAFARQQLIEFLRTLTPQDRVALYSLGTSLRILHDFTDNPEVLLKAIARHKTHIGRELADSLPEESDTGNDELDAFLDEANQQIADLQTRNRVRTTLAAIEAIAQHLSALPGRKNLVWISSGFPFSIGMDDMNPGSTAAQERYSDDMEQTARAVNTAGLAIYPVDARGLIGQPDLNAGVRGQKTVRRPPPQGPSRAMRNIQQTHDTMKVMAERTGGKAYYNTNGLRAAIRAAIDDSRLTYVLGYYPTHNTWDGKFHDLKVKVNRPGLNARHRTGYFAFPERPAAQRPRRAELVTAALSPLDATGIEMSVRLGPDIPQKGTLRALILIQPKHITLEPKDGHWIGSLDLVFLSQGAPDRQPTATDQVLNLNLTKERYQATMSRGLVLAHDFNFTDAAYRIKVLVRDAPTGNLGSLSIRTDHLTPVAEAQP